jgi:hypothetical protein
MPDYWDCLQHMNSLPAEAKLPHLQDQSQLWRRLRREMREKVCKNRTPDSRC